MVSVEIYIKLGDELKRIELFPEEKIRLTSNKNILFLEWKYRLLNFDQLY